MNLLVLKPRYHVLRESRVRETLNSTLFKIATRTSLQRKAASRRWRMTGKNPRREGNFTLRPKIGEPFNEIARFPAFVWPHRSGRMLRQVLRTTGTLSPLRRGLYGGQRGLWGEGLNTLSTDSEVVDFTPEELTNRVKNAPLLRLVESYRVSDVLSRRDDMHFSDEAHF